MWLILNNVVFLFTAEVVFFCVMFCWFLHYVFYFICVCGLFCVLCFCFLVCVDLVVECVVCG
jgi:hypothetical protein